MFSEERLPHCHTTRSVNRLNIPAGYLYTMHHNAWRVLSFYLFFFFLLGTHSLFDYYFTEHKQMCPETHSVLWPNGKLKKLAVPWLPPYTIIHKRAATHLTNTYNFSLFAVTMNRVHLGSIVV